MADELPKNLRTTQSPAPIPSRQESPNPEASLPEGEPGAAHLDSYIPPDEFDVDGDGLDGDGVGESATPGDLTQDQFFGAFRGMIGAPNAIRAYKGRPPLKSLQIADGDRNARAASDALYETCQEVPWLRFLLRPEGKWAQRALVIGSFMGGLAMNVQAEIAAERRAASADTADKGEGSSIPDVGAPIAKPNPDAAVVKTQAA